MAMAVESVYDLVKDMMKLPYLPNNIEKSSYLPNEIECFEARINSFIEIVCKDLTDVASKQEALVNYFSNPEKLVLPYPSLLTHDRIIVSDGLFECIGRIVFRKLVTEVSKTVFMEKEEIQLFGNIGAGKSHLLAMLVIYLHCMHIIDPAKCPKPLFISKCGKSLRGMENVAFELENAIKFANLNANMEVDIQSFGGKASNKFEYICIYDDWNAVEELTPASGRFEMKDLFQNVHNNQYSITAISANSAAGSSTSSKSAPTRFPVFGGLEEAEWECWRADNPVLAAMAADEIEELKFLTGCIPLFISELCSYTDCENWNDKKSKLDESEKIGVGGAWIHEKLYDFAREKFKEDWAFKDHVRVMTSSIGNIKESGVTSTQFDHRFFYKTAVECKLVPICGYVRHKMAIILTSLTGASQFTSVWARKVLADWTSTSPTSNASVAGFAFELYAIEEIIRHPNLIGLPLEANLEVIRFDGDYPLTTDITGCSKAGYFLFWPKKFNLRFIDLLISHVVVENLLRTVSLHAVQISMQTPMEHAHTTKFYTQRYIKCMNRCDFEHYIPANTNTVTHTLHWVLPMHIKSPDLVFPVIFNIPNAPVVDEPVRKRKQSHATEYKQSQNTNNQSNVETATV